MMVRAMMAPRIHWIALLLLAGPSLWAQWPKHASPGVPKLGGGETDLNAPAPKTPEGKPDLTGLWEYTRPPGAPPPAAAAAATTTAGGGLGVSLPGTVSQFWNIGSSFSDGLPFQPWAAELLRQRVATNSKDNPDAHCLPIGLMQLHTHPQPRKIVHTAGVILMVYEANGGLRQIFTDGRALPKNNPQPWWYGYSVGHWEGDTLVVETTGFRDLGWLDVGGSVLTDQAKMIERIRRPSFGRMEIEITVDDPKGYTKPWTVTVHHKILLNEELIEFVCAENEKDAPHLVN